MAKFIFVLSISTFFLLIPSIARAQDAKSKELPFPKYVLPALFENRVQAELELSKEQKTEIVDMLARLEDRKNEYGRELREFQDSGVSPEEVKARRDDVVASFELDKTSTLEKVMNELLPHQQKRLRQSAIQLVMRDSAKKKKLPTGVLVPEVREYLDIDDEQAARIKKRATELQKELIEKIRKLTEQSQKKLMEELTAKQKRKYEEMVGERIAEGR